jgi:hypothetical protein
VHYITHFKLKLPSLDAKVRDYLNTTNHLCEYEYDFGDCWQHLIELEGLFSQENGRTYPACIGGENACPPEDV